MSAPSGYTALDFVGFTDKGTYSPSATYMRNDLVHYGGNIMRCLIDNTTNVTPVVGANWELWVGASANLVERVIAPLENNPADVAYGVGRQIIYDDWLWEVIAPIAVGDALVDYAVDPTNANIKKSAPVETQLLAVKAEADATDNMIAPTETNASSSSAAYAVGDQLILNNILYTVTAPVTIGDALVSGTGGNIEASDNLTDQLAAKANSSDLAAVATSGSYNDLSNKPTLGTAAAKNSTNAVTQGSTDLVESGAVYSEVDSVKQALTNTESSIAPVEDGTNYSKSYTKGAQFIRGGLLYEVTASSVNSSTAINTGSGGNATIASKIVSQIKNIRNNIGELYYFSFNKNELPNGSNMTSLEAVEYFIDNELTSVVTRICLVQEKGGLDYSCLVERVSGASNAVSALCISYNGDLVYLHKNNSSTWNVTYIRKELKYFVGDVITFSNQLNGYNACIGSNDKSLRVFIPLDKPLDSAITSATLSLAYLELWGNGSDVAIHTHITSTSITFNNQGIKLDFTFDSDLTNYGLGFTALANLVAVIQGTITFA